MAEKILKSRIPQKIDTTENWENSSLVLLEGEIGVEKLDDGSNKFKWGDGVNTWNNLPYATVESLNNIFDGIADGSVRTSRSIAESVDYKLGNAAFAEGQNTRAIGNFSHAQNFSSNASGAYSHAGGRESTAAGSVSFAHGYGVVANGIQQTAIGKYNILDNNNEFLFIVGNGTATTARSNAFTIDWDGNVKSNGENLATETYVAENGGKIDGILVNGQEISIVNKQVDIPVPVKTSELTNDSGFLTEHQDISGLAPKATTLEGYGITNAYTKEETNVKVGEVLGTSSDTSTQNTVYGVKALANTKVGNVSAVDTSIMIGGTTTAPTLAVRISSIPGNALSLSQDGLAVIVPTSLDYTVEVTESSSETYAKAYTITQTSTGLNAVINIPRDMVVSSGIVETKTTSGEWGPAGIYLVLTLANTTNDKIYINVGDLIEYVTSGSGPNDEVQIQIDSEHKVTASILDGSILKSKLDSEVQGSLDKADSAIQDISGKVDKNTINETIRFTDNYLYIISTSFSEEGPSSGIWFMNDEQNKDYNGLLYYTEGFGVTGMHISALELSAMGNPSSDSGIYKEVSMFIDMNDEGEDIGIIRTYDLPRIDFKYKHSLEMIDPILLGGIENPVLDNDAANKLYVDTLVANYVTLNNAETIVGEKTFSAATTTFSQNVSVGGNINTTGTITGSKVYNAVWNDYAEWFEKDNLEEKFTAGDICIWTGKGVTKSKQLNEKSCVGVVSDTYGHILGGENLKDMEDNSERYVPIGLKGRVKCKVIGPVEIGDLITTSNLEGIGIVDNNAELNTIIGKALENNYTTTVKTITILV